MAFRWRADAVGPSLNARMVAVIFQGIRTRVAEKPYIFVIFQGGGGRLDPRMTYGGESFGLRPFLIDAPIVLGACLIMLFSVDERGHLGEKFSCRQHLYVRGVALCCVLEQDTFILVLVMIQPRKTRPDISEKKIVDWEVENQIKQNQGRSQRILSC